MSLGLSDAEVMSPPGLSDEDVMTPEPAVSTPIRGPSISGGGLPIAAQIYPRLAPLMDAFGQGFKEGYGPEQLRGLPDETVKMLSDAKIFGPAKGGYDNPLQAAAEMLANSALAPLQGVEQAFRGVSGVMRGAAAVSEELGLPRDISGILGGEYVPSHSGLHATPATAAMRLFGPQHPFGPVKGMPVVLREVPAESRIAPAEAEALRLFRDVQETSHTQVAVGAGDLRDPELESMFDSRPLGEGKYQVVKTANGMSMVVIPTEGGKHLHIESVVGGEGNFGPAGVRHALRELQERYPDAETIGGRRISGARFQSGTENKNVRVSLSSPARAAAEGAPKSIEAYHGAPHDFERFDISKIGEGEGAQAYGHGLYFAQNEAVARSYQNALKRNGYQIGDKYFDPTSDEGLAASQVLQRGPKGAANFLRSAIDGAPNETMKTMWQRALDALPQLEGKTIKEAPPEGMLYRVRINADPDHFLDWDKPLSEQSQVAQDIAERLRKDYPNLPDDFRHIQNGGDLIEAARSVGVDAEKMLREAGIPGIKYLDQGSRNAPAFKPGSNMLSKALDAFDNAEVKNTWVKVPESGKTGNGIYLRKTPDGNGGNKLTIANLAFEQKGTGAFSAYLDHLEQEAKARGYSKVEVENIQNIRLGQFLEKRGYNGVSTKSKSTSDIITQVKNGTRNFVVFDDNSVEITHKNNVPVGPADIPDRNAVSPALTEARELGVIGPPKPDVSKMPPAEAAATEVPRAQAAERTSDDVVRGPAPREPEKAGNIRLDQIGINADAKDVIMDAAKQNDDFNQARAGNVPLAQVESLSGASGVPSAVLSGNEGLGRLMHNDAVVRTWLTAFHQASDEIAAQLAKVKATGDEADIAQLREMKLRFQHMQEQVSGLTAEAGRTLRVFRDFYESRGKAEGIGKLLENNPGNDAESLKKLADAAGSLDPRTQLPKFLHDANKPTWWDKYLYYWVNALISGPVTHLKYIGANAAFGAYEAGVVTPVAGALGAVRRGLLGGSEGVYAGEAAARVYGLLAGTPDALKAAWTAARDNLMTPFPNEIAGKAVNPLTQVRPSAIGGKLGFAIGVPGRSAAGIHSFFRWLGYRAELEAQAYRNAAKEGLSPVADTEAFWQRYAWHAENPTDAAINAGIENGNHLTFIGDQGTFGQAVSRLANTRMGPGGMQPFKLILPFTHIPGQILRAGLEQTPFAIADTKMRADLLGSNGAVAADTARARLIAGGAVSAMVANWAINDTVTGYGPTEQNDRLRWLRTHEPYSVRVGGWWVSYNKFGPIGDLVGLVANLMDIGPKVKEEDYASAAGHVIFSTAHILEDEVGMQGLVNLIEALDDKEGSKMSRFVASQTATNLPYSSLLRQTASFQDPILREAKTFVDGLRYATPWSRQDLLPKRDWLGEPMTNPGYHSILRQRAVNQDPIDIEVSQMRGIRPAPPLARINNVALPPKLYDEYQAYAGALTRVALENIIKQPGWQSVPQFMREQTIHSTIEKMRLTADGIMIFKHPEIATQGIDDKKAKITGEKPTKLKD